MEEEKLYGRTCRVSYVEIDSTGKGNSARFRVPLARPRGSQDDVPLAWWLQHVQIPHTWTQISSTRNTLYFSRSASDYSATLAAADYGNYTPDELAAKVQTAMNAADSNSYTVAYDENTGKFTIAGSAAFEIRNAAAAAGTPIHRFLGFHSPLTTGSATSHVSDGIAQGNLDSILHLHINELAGHDSFDGVIARIPVTTNFLGTVFYQPEPAIKRPLPRRSRIGSLNVQLKHADGSDVDLNGCDWQAVVVLEYGALR